MNKEKNPRYYALIKKFKELTGSLVIGNTFFNVRGEPVICSSEDAFRCFMKTEVDFLIINNTFLIKDEQSKVLASDYKVKYELD